MKCKFVVQAFTLVILFFTFYTDAQENLTFGYTESIHSKILNEDRNLWIKLPENYATNVGTHYPVLYTLDGETHFMRVAGMIQWLSDSSQTIPQHIVVAIHNHGQKRARDTDIFLKDGNISADTFLDFLENELIPHIDKTYRTTSHKILAAHSAQGRFALHIFSKPKSKFDALIAMSPYLNDQTTEFTAKLVQKIESNNTSGSFLYMTLGNEPELKPNINILHQALTKNSKQNSAWEYQYYAKETHMSVPSKTLHNAMLAISIYQGWSIPPNVLNEGSESIVKYYEQLPKKSGEQIVPPLNLFIRLGWNAFATSNYTEGEKSIKTAMKIYPQNSTLYFVLAHIYESAEQLKKARTAAMTAIKMAEDENEKDALVGYKDTLERIKGKM
jgi:predicted alpha/beta superfamily hydrolase